MNFVGHLLVSSTKLIITDSQSSISLCTIHNCELDQVLNISLLSGVYVKDGLPRNRQAEHRQCDSETLGRERV